MNTLEISNQTLRAALVAAIPHVSEDWTRPHLNSVCVSVREGKLTICATDGHRLARWDENTDAIGTFEILIPLDAAKTIAKFTAEKGIVDPMTTLLHDGKTLTVKRHERSATFQTVDAKFPMFEEVMPRSIGNTRPSLFNAEYMADACKAFKDASKVLGLKENAALFFEATGENDPCLFTSEQITQLRVVIMPQRSRGAPPNSIRATVKAKSLKADEKGTSEAAE